MNLSDKNSMNTWFWYAIGAAILYGLHQIFTKMAADRIGDGLGGFVVEAAAAVTILVYLAFLYCGGKSKPVSALGVVYSVLTGICVGVGTVLFFLLFQKGGPLSAVPMILAGGAALMGLADFAVFREPVSWPRVLGIMLSIAGLMLLKK